MSHRNRWAAALLATTALVGGPAWAQSPQAAQAQTGQRAVLEEIVVTAEKRESSIQDVAASITAISGDALSAGGFQDTQQLINLSPNLIVQRSIIGKLHIRGIGNENYSIAGDPSVAVHTDGIYVARAAAGLFDFYDIARVEVLRGPQGTLYGRNATAGVINVIPKAPGKEFEGYATAEYGNYDKIRFEGAVGGPLGDSGLQARVAVLGAWRDGYTTNIFPGADARGLADPDNQDLFAVRGQLQFDNGGPFTARLSIESMRDNTVPPPYKYINQPPAPATAPNPPGLRVVNQGFERQIPIFGGAARSIASDEDIFKHNTLTAGLHLNYDSDAFTLTSITGYRKTNFNWLNDGDGVATFYVNYGQQDETKQWSQEIRIASPDPQAKFGWLAGGYYFRETGSQFVFIPVRLSLFGIFDDSVTSDGESKTNAYAGFGELYYRVTDQLKLTLGGRYSHEKRSVDYLYKGFAGPRQRKTGEESFNNFSPKAVLSYELNDDANLYVSVSRGFKSGGFNFLAFQDGFAPEKIWNYEGGYKATFLDGRARFNASVFYSDFTDLQVGQIVNLQSVLTNAASAELYGLEADFAFLPTDDFEIGGTLGYLHAEFTEFCTADPTRPTARPQAGCTAANPINLKGFTLPRAPRWTVSGYAAYSFTLPGESSLTLRGDVRYQSKTYFTQFNRPSISQGGYAVADARLTWTSANESFSVGVWVKNLFDKEYFTELLESGAFNPTLVEQGYVAPPRTYGVTGTIRF